MDARQLSYDAFLTELLKPGLDIDSQVVVVDLTTDPEALKIIRFHATEVYQDWAERYGWEVA